MKTKLLAAFAAASVLALTGCSGGDEVGDVSLGMFTLKDIKINTFQDPKVPGVTCHVASIEANLSLADPSDIYDAETQTLLYISYSTKETTGSFKHSLSTIPLWGTAAWENRPPVPAKTI